MAVRLLKPEDTEKKVCVLCKEKKFLRDFDESTKYPDGRTIKCKDCKRLHYTQRENLFSSKPTKKAAEVAMLRFLQDHPEVYADIVRRHHGSFKPYHDSAILRWVTNRGKGEKVEVSCAYCGNKLVRRVSELSKTKTGKYYCNSLHVLYAIHAERRRQFKKDAPSVSELSPADR